ncbi:MAG: hypothetical protein CL554_20050 [Algoriphagus sp.]|uniref:hypothetical protein n=1 Tax=Algoriphagus sp. TaxID=1872435 RepID=UPI000C3532E5|nr:hypothetical protein [Algoriphagus sp.]MAL15702.1 hypothetical protein [Algoriphagus sp.]
MSASEASSFEELVIQSNDQKRTANLTAGVVSVDYYEDILSPTVTAKIRVINTGDSIAKEGLKEKQSIYNGLPLRGGERLSMKILDQGKTGKGKEKKGLDFSNPEKYLFVSSITQVLQEEQRESFLLNLVSREAITNETTRVYKRYKGRISDTVRKILTDPLIGLNVDKSKLNKIVESTKGSYDFVGNLRKPFSTLISLASKSIPVKSGDATAGFVFFQTQDGFRFSSIDSLIKQKSKATYTYTDVNESSITKNNDYKILQYTVDKNQNLIENLRMGTYSFRRLSFNPLSFQFKQEVYNYGDKNSSKKNDRMNNLGTKELQLPKISDDSKLTLDQLPTRTVSQIVDIGASTTVSKDDNYPADKYQGQNVVRYNLLMTQSVSMTVPCNTDLKAGDIITCRFPKISREDKNEYDPEESGKYMIKELCHHFEAKRSFTSMTLVRDTYGFYGGES